MRLGVVELCKLHSHHQNGEVLRGKTAQREMEQVVMGTGRDCHGLPDPRTRSRRVQQGTGTGWLYPTPAIPVPPAGGWRVGPHIQTPRKINPNDARRQAPRTSLSYREILI
jgi:hypothetical protein